MWGKEQEEGKPAAIKTTEGLPHGANGGTHTHRLGTILNSAQDLPLLVIKHTQKQMSCPPASTNEGGKRHGGRVSYSLFFTKHFFC